MSQSHSLNQANHLHLSNEGWAGIQRIAAQFNLSVSELLEQLGRGLLVVVDAETLEDYLDLQDALDAEADPQNQARIPWEQIKQELEL
jgi:putative heme iron utilization protein